MISPFRMMAVLRKELLQLKRDRMTFGMIVMIPIIQLLLFGYAIETNLRHIPAALVDQAQSGLSRALVQMVEATQIVDFTERHMTAEAAERAIRAGHVRAAFVIPEDLAGRLVRSPAVGMDPPPATDAQVSRPVAQWIVDGSDTTIGAALKSLRNMPLTELFRRPQNMSVPTFEVALFYNPEQRTEVNIVPGLVGIILTMTMVLFTSAAIVRESEHGNMEMLINTPVRPVELMLGKIVPFLGIGLIQACLILGLGRAIFGVAIVGSLWLLLWGGLLFIAASLSLGLVISTIAKTQLQAMQMTFFIVLPSILLSGFMFPYEGMPVPAQWLANALPVTHFLRLIRGVVLRDAGLAEIGPQMLWLACFAAIGLGIASLRFRKRLD
ncbi:ABC transporter permease [Mangrovicoccus sp. HB161399]|uniref:ABC transporter permease n=1 Tax=Mangrovicoccus sp. HB161399 TaxID=2720392 RepID=UPI001557CE2F|nr:ABC transporter permease [Mangrovicoccus sp. HB161399]